MRTGTPGKKTKFYKNTGTPGHRDTKPKQADYRFRLRFREPGPPGPSLKKGENLKFPSLPHFSNYQIRYNIWRSLLSVLLTLKRPNLTQIINNYLKRQWENIPRGASSFMTTQREAKSQVQWMT